MIVSVFSLCTAAYRTSELDFDIVGILSLLVTVLIGWNIYTAIDMKMSISTLNEKIGKIESDLNTKISHLTDGFLLGIKTVETQSLLGVTMLYANNPELDRYNHGLVIEYGLYLIENHINRGDIDKANQIVRVLNDCLRNGGRVLEYRKKFISDIALSINGFSKLTEGDKLMFNILGLDIVKTNIQGSSH